MCIYGLIANLLAVRLDFKKMYSKSNNNRCIRHLAVDLLHSLAFPSFFLTHSIHFLLHIHIYHTHNFLLYVSLSFSSVYAIFLYLQQTFYLSLDTNTYLYTHICTYTQVLLCDSSFIGDFCIYVIASE